MGALCFGIIAISCKVQNTKNLEPEDRSYYVSQCKSYRIKSNKQITWSKVILNENEEAYNQVRYCTRHPDIMADLLFEELGHWDFIYVDEEKKSVFLLWTNAKINGIDNSFSYALTSYHDCLSSVIVFDKKYKDMLDSESDYKAILLEQFKSRINSYDLERNSPYRINHREEIAPIYKKFQS